jgi:hypothetical protein
MTSRLVSVLRILVLFSLLVVPLAARAQPPANDGPIAATVIESSLANHFIHIVTAENTTGPATMLRNPALDGNPNARILVTRLWRGLGLDGGYNDHSFAVVYVDGYWWIYNQDKGDFELGVAFNVVVPTVGYNTILHRATSANIYGNWTIIDNPYLNGNPDALLFVTQNVTPGDGSEVWNDHPIGVWYTGTYWTIYNEDMVPMPEGASFNVMLALPSYTTLVHRAQAGNIADNWTEFTHPRTDNNRSVLLFITPNWRGTYDVHPTGVFLNEDGRWAIYNELNDLFDEAPMPVGATFNVLIIGTKTYLPSALRLQRRID